MHDSHRGHAKVRTASDRSFGLTVGGILLAIVAYRLVLAESHAVWLTGMLAVVGGALVLLGWLRPVTLGSANRAWTALGLLLGRVMTPVVMGLLYVTTIVPIGLLMRVLGKDPLDRRRDPQATSYWIVRDEPGPQPAGMNDQF